MATISFVKDNVPKEVLEILGEMSINFVYLQSYLVLTISSLTSTEAVLMDSLLGRDNFEPLLSKFQKAFIYGLDPKKLITNELQDEFDEVVDKIIKAKSSRNKLLHSIVYTNEKGELKLRTNEPTAKTFKELKPKREVITMQKLIDTNEKIRKATTLLYTFRQKIIKLLSSEKEKNDNQEKENNQKKT